MAISGPGGTTLWAILPRDLWERLVTVVQGEDLDDDGDLLAELLAIAPRHWDTGQDDDDPPDERHVEAY
jgi:hypothetical protein